MAEIKECQRTDPWTKSKARVTSYMFTITDLNDPLLKQLRHLCKIHNAQVRRRMKNKKFGDKRARYHDCELRRVAIMPRGPRVEAAWGDYKSKKAYDSYLPMRHGTSFDVYYRQDPYAEYTHNHKLEVADKIADLEHQLHMLKTKGYVPWVD